MTLKKAMTTPHILAMPNFKEPFTIETGVASNGIRAVLTKNRMPITFTSEALGVVMQARSICAKEILAIVEAVRTWRPYILGQTFYVKSDQTSLKFFIEQRITMPEQERWVAIISIWL